MLSCAVPACVVGFDAILGYVIPPLTFQASSGFFLAFFDFAFLVADVESVGDCSICFLDIVEGDV